MDVLAQIGDQVVAELNRAGKAEDKIGEIVAGGIARDRAVRRLPQMRAGRFAELAGVGVGAVQRIDIQNLGADGHEFIAHLDGVAALYHREIEFGIEGGRILELRIAGLAAQLREAADGLRIQPAGQIGRGRQPGDAIELLHAGAAQIAEELFRPERDRSRSALRAMSRRNRPGVAGRRLLLDGMDVAVAVSARRPGNVGLIILQILALAEAQERGHLVVDLVVEFRVVLVAVIANQQQRFVDCWSGRDRSGRAARSTPAPQTDSAR